MVQKLSNSQIWFCERHICSMWIPVTLDIGCVARIVIYIYIIKIIKVHKRGLNNLHYLLAQNCTWCTCPALQMQYLFAIMYSQYARWHMAVEPGSSYSTRPNLNKRRSAAKGICTAYTTSHDMTAIKLIKKLFFWPCHIHDWHKTRVITSWPPFISIEIFYVTCQKKWNNHRYRWGALPCSLGWLIHHHWQS